MFKIILIGFLLLGVSDAFAAYTIVVDKRDFMLTLYKDGAKIHTQKVIVGKTSRPTPNMQTTIRNIELNPIWNIPNEIDNKYRIRIKRDPRGMYLRGYRITQNGREVLNDNSVDWNRPLQISQINKYGNALGRLMFVIDNSTSSQMHDTPEKHLFKKKVRRFSSGCIRVEDAERLASLVLNVSLGDVRKMIKTSGREAMVSIPQPIVFIVR